MHRFGGAGDQEVGFGRPFFRRTQDRRTHIPQPLPPWAAPRLLDNKLSLPYSRVTEEEAGVGPMDDLRAVRFMNKQPVQGTTVRYLNISNCLSDPFLNKPCAPTMQEGEGI